MIPLIEIQENAREWGLRPTVVEKDYTLGWVLAAIASHPVTKGWVFKGGTCLKKCYFETYRFSEDLDFTIRDGHAFEEAAFKSAFHEISAWVYEQSGVELPKDGMVFDLYQNPRGRPSMEGRLSYRGPLAPRGALPRIKLDLTRDEVLASDPVSRPIAHPYSDKLPQPAEVLAYSYEEVFGEKLRALAERQLPRDLYDVINIYRHSSLRPAPEIVWEVLLKKCAHKGIQFPSLEELKKHPRHPQLSSEWANMLAHQLPSLPPMSLYWDALPEVFDWVKGKSSPAPLPRIAVGHDVEPDWAPSSTVARWGQSVPIETIRYAGANRLCVQLQYRKQGARPARPYTIEPYSLRRTREGNVVLYGIKTDSHENRSFRVDWIEGVTVTDRPFTPTYMVEFTEAAPASAPRLL